jgi:hypothetical protein
LALAKLVPGLGADAHAAAGALLVIDAGDAGAAGAGDAVETEELLGVDKRAEGLAGGVESGQFGGEVLLAEGDAGAGFVESGGEGFDLGAGGGEGGFLGFRADEAGEGIVFEAIGFGGFEGDFVLDGVGLAGLLNGVELVAEAGCFLAVSSDFALQAGAQGFFAKEQIGGHCGLALGGGESGFGLGDLSRQGA